MRAAMRAKPKMDIGRIVTDSVSASTTGATHAPRPLRMLVSAKSINPRLARFGADERFPYVRLTASGDQLTLPREGQESALLRRSLLARR